MSNASCNLDSLLPHKDKMVLLDNIISYDVVTDEICAEVVIKRTSMFFDEERQCVPAWIGIEYMAQAIAAYSSIDKHGQDGQNEPKIGLLLGTRNYKCFFSRFSLEQRLHIKATQEYRDNNLACFDCVITSGEQIWAEAQITVYEPDDIDELLKGR